MLAQKSSSEPFPSGGPPASGGTFASGGGPCESGGSFGPGTTGECSNSPGGYPSCAANAREPASTVINTRVKRFMAANKWHCVAQTATDERNIERPFRPFQGEDAAGRFGGLSQP